MEISEKGIISWYQPTRAGERPGEGYIMQNNTTYVKIQIVSKGGVLQLGWNIFGPSRLSDGASRLRDYPPKCAFSLDLGHDITNRIKLLFVHQNSVVRKGE